MMNQIAPLTYRKVTDSQPKTDRFPFAKVVFSCLLAAATHNVTLSLPFAVEEKRPRTCLTPFNF
ncbi:MAG: hypothetical protein ACUVTP_03630 [Candidatus Fervidibacter sp.]|uniref:hypothetical protein n=1 Tax=Candidatus Fervidibacter sp. TaxID=3100871 RepID=UPI00404A065C